MRGDAGGGAGGVVGDSGEGHFLIAVAEKMLDMPIAEIPL